MKSTKVRIMATEDGKEFSVFVKSPTIEDKKTAKEASNRTFRDAIKSGALLQAKTEETLRDQGLWNDEKKTQLRDLDSQIDVLLLQLKKGGIRKSEGRELAIKVSELRQQQLDLVNVLRSLDEFTAESQATDAHFDTLCTRCIVDDFGTPKFKSLDEYRDQAHLVWVMEAASKLAEMVSVFDADWRKKLPENSFLVNYGYMNDELNYIDKEGRVTDREGRLLDVKTRRFINEGGEFVNRLGQRVDDDGNVIVESLPFLDEDGTPIQPKNGQPVGIKDQPNTILTPEKTAVSSTQTVENPVPAVI